jgi:hypothetical protein
MSKRPQRRASKRAVLSKALAAAQAQSRLTDERLAKTDARLEQIERTLTINFQRIAQIQLEIDRLTKLLSRLSLS